MRERAHTLARKWKHVKRPGRARRQREVPRLVPAAVGIGLVVVTAFALAVALWRTYSPTTVAGMPVPETTDQCRSTPQFTADPAVFTVASDQGAGTVSVPGALALSTEGREKGLALITGEAQAPYQHATWDDAGYLGAITYDRDGNIYAAPTPRLSLVDNPLAGVTTLWRVASATAEMRPFVTLPGAANERNPFGVLGLFYTCDNNTLYAGTVIGSTPSNQQGGVVAVHLSDGVIHRVLTNLDVMGVLVVRQGERLMLYAGLARSPDIVAVPLDEQGLAAGPITPLIDLTLAGATPQERARKLRLVNGVLVADLVPFNFSLQSSASGSSQLRRAAWEWDTVASRWVVQQAATSDS